MDFRRLLRKGLAGFLVALLLAVRARADVHDHDQFREDVLACEEALAHVKSCCSGLTRAIRCQYSYDYEPPSPSCSGNGGSQGYENEIVPDFTLDDSACLRGMTCDELDSKGVCARLEGPWEPHTPVCP